MFIPIGDTCPRYRRPYVTFALIALNVLVYIFTCRLNAFEEGRFLNAFASFPDEYNPLRSVTAGFVHADIFHILGNMWFLFLFGSSVEGKLGHRWMAATYGACLLLADFAQCFFGPGGHIPTIGASGAVGGIMGAYWFLFSRCEVEFFYWFYFYAGRVMLGVHWAIAWLFGWDLILWIVERKSGEMTGIAHSAHLGGLVSGLACGLLIRRYSHVVLDGDDMYTRFMVWKIKVNAAAETAAAPKLTPKPIEKYVPPPLPFPDETDPPKITLDP
ncbi:MAG TPA: rhomboid family intramembrane serine protease [Planctomycetota bacterium]|jgi:membrane associated rhomboid family serine protease